MENNNISKGFSDAVTAEQIKWQSDHLLRDAQKSDLTDDIKDDMLARISGVIKNIEEDSCAMTLSTSQIALDSVSNELQYALNSITDHLTGLLNKAGIEKFAKAQFSMAKRHVMDIGVFFIDLNKFKPINDKLGHEDGDKALKFCASKIKNHVRREDVLARVGGDEFIIIMLNKKAHDWTIQYNKLKELFDNDVIYESDKGVKCQIDASIGFVIALDDELPEQAIKRADIEMYKVKKGNTGANSDLGFEQEDIPLTIQETLDFEPNS